MGDHQEIVSTKFNGKILHKRDLTIYDETQTEIKLTVWNEKALDPSIALWLDKVVAFKGVRIGDYQGKNLGSTSSTGFALLPPIPEGHQLATWKESLGSGDLRLRALSSSAGTRSIQRMAT